MRKSLLIVVTTLVLVGWATKPGTNPYYECMLANRKPCELIKSKKEQDACIAKVAHECQCKTWDPSILLMYRVTCP